MKRLWTGLIGALLVLTLAACSASSGGHGESHGGGSGEESHGDSHDGGHEHGEGEGMNTQAIFSFPQGTPGAGKETALEIRIQDDKGTPVDSFEVNHEKLLHLIIVNEDLSTFDHVHPEHKGNGTFALDTTFPAGGQYKLFADFVPTGTAGTTISKWIEVAGAAPPQTEPSPDESYVKTVDGKEVELAFDLLEPNKDTLLTFTIRDAATKAPIETLQPYLGAVGHVVILSEDAEQYLHVHPDDERATGPDAAFHTSFPEKGVYKIWGQFQHEGKVFTVPFVVEVT